MVKLIEESSVDVTFPVEILAGEIEVINKLLKEAVSAVRLDVAIV